MRYGQPAVFKSSPACASVATAQVVLEADEEEGRAAARLLNPNPTLVSGDNYFNAPKLSSYAAGVHRTALDARAVQQIAACERHRKSVNTCRVCACNRSLSIV
jgi:hypothetical protein